MNYELHNTECLAWLAEQPAASFDAIIADPPYQTTNLAFDRAPGLDWAAWWAEAWRVVKPAGVVVLFAADLFTVDLILSQRANYRYRLVWEKTRLSRFFDANRRPLQGHEDILVFCQKPKASTYNPQKTWHPERKKKRPPRPVGSAGHYGADKGNTYNDTGERHPHTVLQFNSVCNSMFGHPTSKPVELMRWLIRSYSNPGDAVLDCFAGSGSTLEACLLEGRHGVGTELDPTYYAKAQARLQAIAAKPQLAF